MNQAVAKISDQPAGALVRRMAGKFGVDENKLLTTLKNTAFKVKNGEASNEQMMALMVVADQHNLNPFTREIFAFPDKQNGIVPVVSVDGWSRIVNSHPQFDGADFRYSKEIIEPGDDRCKGLKHAANEWIECVIYRKDREHPIVVREYLDEVYRPPFEGKGQNGSYTVEGAWQSHTRRMHRHKTWIQCARVAFGFGGIYDEDEAERIIEARRAEDGSFDATPERARPERPELGDEQLRDYIDSYADTIEAGDSSPGQLIAMLESKYALTDEQKAEILAAGNQGEDNEAA